MHPENCTSVPISLPGNDLRNKARNIKLDPIMEATSVGVLHLWLLRRCCAGWSTIDGDSHSQGGRDMARTHGHGVLMTMELIDTKSIDAV